MNNNMISLLSIKNILIYIIIINLFTFLLMAIDKNRSIKNQWRIKESTLFFSVLLGGGIGGILGIYFLRHKTKKKYFTIGFPIILIIELSLLIYYFVK
ncbi:MAG TPA: DUF1294 domain-containing protein [Clostridia bacterium]|nr:DUF1294 domain-containing protein [Clostridia bacterium]